MASATPSPTTSVVIAARDGADTIAAQLGALLAQETARPWELVVVDNGSTDATPDIVEQHRRSDDRVRLVAEPRAGAARARNTGVGAARGDVLLFCDADDVAHPGWIDAMAARAEDAGLVGGWIETATLNPGLAGRRGPRNGCVTHLGFLRSAPTANLAVHREVFERVGLFRSLTAGAAGEDVEFCWRAQLGGFELVDEPGAVMAYRLRTSARATFRQSYGYGRAEVRLYQLFRRAGAQRPTMRSLAARQVRHLRRTARVLTSADLRRRQAEWYGRRLGRLDASVEQRVWMP